MPTIRQLVKFPRKTKPKVNAVPALDGCPQKKASCMKVFHKSPKKPNSAVRKVSKVRLGSNLKEVVVYIPGTNHSISEHASVLIRGGETKDLPGLKYKIIRGVLDAKPVGPLQEKGDLVNRSRGRSLYGVKKVRDNK